MNTTHAYFNIEELKQFVYEREAAALRTAAARYDRETLLLKGAYQAQKQRANGLAEELEKAERTIRRWRKKLRKAGIKP